MDYRIFGEVDNNHLKGRVRFGPEKTVVVGHSESASHFFHHLHRCTGGSP